MCGNAARRSPRLLRSRNPPMSIDPIEPGATSARGAEGRLIALKHDDALVVADAWGDILGDGDGLFLEGDRLVAVAGP